VKEEYVPVILSPTIVIVALIAPESVTVGEQTRGAEGTRARMTTEAASVPPAVPTRSPGASENVSANVPDTPAPV